MREMQSSALKHERGEQHDREEEEEGLEETKNVGVLGTLDRTPT
jgi:hypothetical protein